MIEQDDRDKPRDAWSDPRLTPAIFDFIAEIARVSCECDDIPNACAPCRAKRLLAEIEGLCKSCRDPITSVELDARGFCPYCGGNNASARIEGEQKE